MLQAAVTKRACGRVKVAEPALSHAQKAKLQAYLQAGKRLVVLYGGSGWTGVAGCMLNGARVVRTYQAAESTAFMIE